MNILMFGMSSFPGGIENYLINYFSYKELPAEVHIDYVVPGGTVAFQSHILHRGDNVLNIEEPKSRPVKYITSLIRIISKNKYDVAYINMLSAANILPVILSKLLGIPCVIVHSHASGTIKGVLRNFLHKTNRKVCTLLADKRLACSENAGQWIFGAKMCTIIPNAIQSDKFAFSIKNRNEIRARFSIPNNCFVIGHVGRLAEEKNHQFLLSMLPELVRWNKNIRMFFVGEGSQESEINKSVCEMGLEKHLIIASASDETFKFYSAFDCFAFPSVFEGFGMAALEAQAAGLKCFCSSALPPEVNVNGNVEFLSIDEGVGLWIQKIKDYICGSTEKPIRATNVPQSDFDIKNAFKTLLNELNI